MLTAAPTGVSWSSIPSPKSTPDQQYAEQLNLCARASAMVNSFCNVPLRATIDTELLTGPGDFRFQLQPTGRARLLLSRPPVVQVLSGQWTPAGAFPAQWTPIAGSQFRIEKPLMGVYGTTAPGTSEGGQAVLLAPGIVNWSRGRQACDVQVTYLNGWPHASLNAKATAGTQALNVDDITGWPGAAGTVHDAAGQEAVAVTAVTPATAGAVSGPGTLTLSAPLAYTHNPGVLVTALPGIVVQAAIMLATSQALIRGATATTVQTLPGSRAYSSTSNASSLIADAKAMLQPFRRAI
ncbi:hypothetical protein [Streptomyces sp. NPDC001404]|uniref:hypothetical protein n=1 Tax=Streptomyces sp. NPDC001404 TaxID=3364571 RepID=UPI0036BB3C6D